MNDPPVRRLSPAWYLLTALLVSALVTLVVSSALARSAPSAFNRLVEVKVVRGQDLARVDSSISTAFVNVPGATTQVTVPPARPTCWWWSSPQAPAAAARMARRRAGYRRRTAC